MPASNQNEHWGNLQGIFEVPKTLIFGKTDSHADDIIQITREEFGEGNAFCKKILINDLGECRPDEKSGRHRAIRYNLFASLNSPSMRARSAKQYPTLSQLRRAKRIFRFYPFRG